MKMPLIFILIFSLSFLVFSGFALGDSNSSNNYNPTLSPPQITYNPIPIPSPPSFPESTITVGGWNITIGPWTITFPSLSFGIPDWNNIPSFLFTYAMYVFEIIGVEIANFLLALVQAFYYVFAYIEYLLLYTILTASNGLGIFALPFMVTVTMVTGIIVSIVIHFAKDITIVGAG
jgi:hypothetical protein